MTRLAILLVFGLMMADLAHAQRLVGAMSGKTISISSNFSGETLTLFGNVEPEVGAEQRHVEGPFDIIMVIRGPAFDRVAREKTHEWGIWLNTDQLVFRNFPSYFWVLSSDKLNDITDEETLIREGLLPETRPQLAVVQGSGDPEKFGTELVRLMTQKGLFGLDERGVLFQSDTLYSARLSLPSNVPNGSFLAYTYLFKDGVIVAQKAEAFSVRKTGFERFLGMAAQQSPWAYGITCVLLAVFTGWLGGVVFRR